MAKPFGIRARRIMDILSSISIVISGLCLIGGCLMIYTSEGGYSREAVADIFSKIAIPVYITLALIAAGSVWELIAPSATAYRKTPKAYALLLGRLHETRDQDADAGTKQAVAKEQARRKAFAIVRMVLMLLGCAVFFGYAVQPQHYDTADINGSMIRAMWVAIPCFVVPAVLAVIAAYVNNKSYQREIDLLKALPMKAAIPIVEQTPAADRHTAVNALRVVLIVFGIAALIYGFVAGGTVDVLTKAINICTECIGLG